MNLKTNRNFSLIIFFLNWRDISWSAVNASYLGKNGAVTYLFKLLAVCGKKQLTHSKHALDTLTQLVKSSECSSFSWLRSCGTFQIVVSASVSVFYCLQSGDYVALLVEIRPWPFCTQTSRNLTLLLSAIQEPGSRCYAKLSVTNYFIHVVESNSARAVGHGGVPILLNMFYDWHRSDAKNRHVALRKAILNVLKHCTNLSEYTPMVCSYLKFYSAIEITSLQKCSFYWS